MIIKSILLFGDTYGIPQLLKLIDTDKICGLVAASIRPHQHQELKSIAGKYKLPFLIQKVKKSADYLDFIEKIVTLAPELILVNSYSMLLHPEILEIPTYGAVNIHGALLPQYRGCNPIQYALLNRETETGVTIHYMNSKFDAGDIIAQKKVKIYFEDTWLDVQKRISIETEALLAQALPPLINLTNSRYPQDEIQAHHYRRRYPEDGLIEWSKGILDIYNLIRALVHPHPGAFYYAEDKKNILDNYLSIPQITTLKYTVSEEKIKSKDIILTPLKLSDLPLLFSLEEKDHQILSYKINNQSDKKQHEYYLRDIHNKNDLVMFSIYLLKSEQLIGTCQLLNIDYSNKEAELQVDCDKISEDYKANEIEVIQLLLHFAFAELALHRVYVHVVANNQPSINLYKKIGFVEEGILRKSAYINGQYIDVLIMGILQEEYEKI